MTLALCAVWPGMAFGDLYAYTGAEQSYSVPAGVTSVHVVVTGAPGGGSVTGADGTPFTGGRGAEIAADLPIPQGQTVLYVEVGGTGTGFNGGGAPNGGDASDIRTIPRDQPGSIDSRLIVAGGGGGLAQYDGGDAGMDGGGPGGRAGTAGAGGAGGAGIPESSCSDGQAGSLGQGGNAGPMHTYSATLDGGGGGGGYYGGGGGGFIGDCSGYLTPGTGGGGGSSFVTPTATNQAVGLDPARIPQVTITPVTAAPPPTVTPPPPVATPAPPSAPAVSLSHLRLTPRRFALSGRLAGGRCVAAAARAARHRHCRRPISLRIGYVLNGPATVTMTMQRTLAGRISRGRCQAADRADRRSPRCVRAVPLPGSLSQRGAAGHNALSFDGRLDGRRLDPGVYTLTATAVGAGGSRARLTAGFTIVR